MVKDNANHEVVSKRLGNSSIRITLDSYSYVLPGLKGIVAQPYYKFITPRLIEKENVSKVLGNRYRGERI